MELSCPMAETGDRSVSLDQSGIVDVAQPLPDRYVLLDATQCSTVHEVGDLIHANPGDQVPGFGTLHRCDDGEVGAVEDGRSGEEQNSVAEPDGLGGVQRMGV